MAKIHELKISNFRGIKTFSHKFRQNFICFLGRGDSGKTTILDAISCVLSTSWNLTFYDSDFFNSNTDDCIAIEVSLRDLPTKFIKEEKYGFYIRGLDSNGNIQDELQDDHEKILTIKLEVKKDLEPQWYVVNNSHEPRHIPASDRAKLNVYIVSDYIDRHFSWSRGNPLYSILKEKQSVGNANSDVIIEALRGAKEKIDNYRFEQFSEVTESIKKVSSNFGIDLSEASTAIDFKDIFIKDGRVCLHDGNVPLRLKGKGTKRLISMAIQTVLAIHGGIMLIDEVEQGLEPDRAKHLARSLKKDNAGQIFLTTHSSEVITELEAKDLIIVKNDKGSVTLVEPNQKFQDIIRACPEAGYAKKVIVCEGKTEIGICRALDTYRRANDKAPISFHDCVYSLGNGDSLPERTKKLNDLGLKVCIFCDSDKDLELKPSKDDLKKLNIKIFDCDNNNCIEQQAFQDLPWEGVKELLSYIEKKENLQASISNIIKSRCDGHFPQDWKEQDTPEMRRAIGKTAKDKDWFKRIDHGEFLGDVIFKFFGQIAGKNLREQLESLSNWIDE